MKKLKNNKNLILCVKVTFFVFALLPIIIYLINTNAQALVADDYAFLEYYKLKPALNILSDLVTIQHTPQIRFVFIPHVLFLPFYKYSHGQEWTLNLFFIVILTQLFVFIPLVVNKILKLRLGSFTQITFLAFFTLLALNYQIWYLADFKLSSYMVTGSVFMLLYLYLLTELDLNKGKSIAILIAAFIMAIHMTDMNILLILPTFVLTTTSNATIRKKFILIVGILIYPPFFYIFNKLIIPRGAGAFENKNITSLMSIFFNKLEYFVNENKVVVSIAMALIIICLVISVQSIKIKTKNQITVYINRNLLLLIDTFFLFYGFALLLITNFAYGGWINPHQYSIAYLMLILSIIFSTKYIHDKLQGHSYRLSKVFIISILLLIGANSVLTLKDLRIYLAGRHVEIQTIHSLENEVAANVDDLGTNNLIVIDEWPDYYIKYFSTQSFYGIDWVSRAYAKIRLNRDGKKFMFADQPFVYSSEYDTLLLLDYNSETKSSKFKIIDCKADDCPAIYKNFLENKELN